MNLYLRFLESLLFVRLYDSKTINVFAGDQAKATKLRQKGLTEGHIKELSITKRERTIHTETVFMLTSKGIEFIRNELTGLDGTEFPFLDTKQWSVQISRDRHQEKILRIRKASQVLTMAHAIGAEIPVRNFRLNEAGKPGTSVYDAVASAISSGNCDTANIYPYLTEPQQLDLRFHNSDYIKSVLGQTGSGLSKSDFDSGRYSGVLDSAAKCILLYGTPFFGMDWFKGLCTQEMGAYLLWKSYARETFGHSVNPASCAALLVKNAQQFSNLFYEKDTAERKNNRDAIAFGGEFDSFYIIPTDSDGAEQLKLISTIYKDSELMMGFAKRVISEKRIIAGRQFEISANPPGSEFPLEDKNGNPVALGQMMDAKQMMRIREQAQYLGRRCAVICFDWQMPYFAAVMPENVELLGF